MCSAVSTLCFKENVSIYHFKSHYGIGSPLSGAAVTNSPVSSASQASSSIPRRLSRTKRCSCSSFLDKECIYFCHLDIIWINTPERVVPYGLGSSPRVKRSVKKKLTTLAQRRQRCECRSQEDSVCWQFCEDGQQTPRFSVKTKVQKQSTVEASDRMDHNKPNCTGLNCICHLLNMNKRLESANSKHLPTLMKWIYRIRELR
ncbi:endothelin-1 isoform X1 [Stegostoma tigrinum]|uniref:endothelin-1 isoform X1 n=1 Tax=Stegostoma tigrinum TaxID=3053191 RepID=UPI00202AC858|nr:endothelin-1 isoform X1 [Stegostoma tigrinum]